MIEYRTYTNLFHNLIEITGYIWNQILTKANNVFCIIEFAYRKRGSDD